jgi:hypothetical protein
LGVVNVASKRALDGDQVGLVGVCGKLDAVGEAGSQVVHELNRSARVPVADQPARDQLRFGVNGRPSPNVAVAELPSLVLGHVLLFRVAERPNFVALNPLAGEVAERPVLVLRARLPGFNLELDDRVDGDSAKASSCPNADPFNEARKDAGSVFDGQLVHAFHDTKYRLAVKHFISSKT